MTIRVRPADVKVPEDDPFQNDLLDRKASIEALTGLLGAVQGPCVLALDSEWGGGKTTFLKMWAAHLRNEGFSVAEFNAWETDFSGDPFVALSSRLQEQFDTARPDDGAESVQRFTNAAKRIALRAAPIALRALSQGLLDAGSLEQAITDEVSSYAKDRLEEFEEVEQSFVDFKESLQEEALLLSKKHDDRPLFIMIDELDRCRPSYTIELLEAAKHLFSVDQIIFVLAVNRSELAHSVKALYGSKFDAAGYLHRFFDLDYILPTPDRETFVLQGMIDTGLDAFFCETPETFQTVPKMIARMLAGSGLDLRNIRRTIHRQGLIVSSQTSVFPAIVTRLSVALVMRALDPELYQQFSRGDIPDIDVINQIYTYGALRELQYEVEGHIFEATVSVMWCELSGKAEAHEDKMAVSPCLRNYLSTRQRLEQRMHDIEFGTRRAEVSVEDRQELSRASGVINAAKSLLNVPNETKYSSVSLLQNS